MICYLDQSGQLGGAELCLADIARHCGGRVVLLSEGPFARFLQDRQVEVTVLPMPGVLSRTTRAARFREIVFRWPAGLRYVNQLRKALRGARLLYCNTPKALIYGTVANWGSGRPVVFHLHDLLTPEHFSRSNLRLLVMAANRARAVIANSRATADAFRNAGGKTTVTVIPNGFATEPFDTVPLTTIKALRAEFNPGNRPVVAIFGRLARWKGQDVLLRALHQLPGVMAWVVGDALFTGDDRAYADNLHHIAPAERVRFLGFRNDIPALMLAADVVVHCSVAPEPFGRVLVEGMLARKPVVAARGGGADEIVEGVGTLLPAGDVDALAQALRVLTTDPELRETQGRLGRERAVSRYGLSGVLDQTTDLLHSLMPA